MREKLVNMHAGGEFLDLFWVGVEPLGQPELSLPAEEENKLDRHHKVFSFSCTEYNLLSCFQK